MNNLKCIQTIVNPHNNSKLYVFKENILKKTIKPIILFGCIIDQIFKQNIHFYNNVYSVQTKISCWYSEKKCRRIENVNLRCQASQFLKKLKKLLIFLDF